jgi:hypothetical protein
MGGDWAVKTDAPHMGQNLALADSAAWHCGQLLDTPACRLVCGTDGALACGVSILGNGPQGIPSRAPPLASLKAVPQVVQND